MEDITKRKRIWELDFLRGLAIFMMVFDHFMFDLLYLPNYFSNFYLLDITFFNELNRLAIMYWTSSLRFFGREFFVLVFLLVAGISYTFSKDNLKRGLKILSVAMLITLVTYLVDLILNFNVLIVFGVIHMFGVNILLTVVIRKFIKSDILILLMGMLILTFSFIFGLFTPTAINLSFANLPKIILGLNYFGADHFGILPYLGIILIGTVVGNVFYKNKVSLLPHVKVTDKNFFNTVGRNSLIVYVLHQPLVLLFVTLIVYVFGYRF